MTGDFGNLALPLPFKQCYTKKYNSLLCSSGKVRCKTKVGLTCIDTQP